DLVNNDLANTIGNLLNRTSSMARKWFDGCVPPADAAAGDDHPLARTALEATQTVPAALERIDFRTAAEAVLQLAVEANGFLNEQAPWKRMKEPGQEAAVGNDLYAVLETCRLVAVLLGPLLPDLSERMLVQLGQEPLQSGGDAVPTAGWRSSLRWGLLPPGQPLIAPTPVMQRLELEAPL
ncbi:MAG: methionine--tRNA ligase, partial [Cyanobium sp.]